MHGRGDVTSPGAECGLSPDWVILNKAAINLHILVFM